MDRKVTIYCKTRKFDGDDAVTTKLTLDYSACTQEDVYAMADDSAVIKWQAGRRRMKDAPIPKEATYVVPKPGTKSVVQLTPFEHLCEVFGKDRMLKLVNEAGGDIDAVVKKFTALAKEMGLE